MLRYEPQTTIEAGLIYLTKVLSEVILKEYEKPVNSDLAGIEVKGEVTTRFTEDKRKLSYCTPWLRTVTYSARDIDKFTCFDDLVDLVVHECCHFAVIGHGKRYWQEYARWRTAVSQMLGEDCFYVVE